MLLNSDPIKEDLGLLLLRVGAGGAMIYQHGWPKLAAFGERMDTFSDPLGLGPAVSLTLIVFAEFVCAALVVLGLWTRLATIPLIIGMGVIVFIVQADAPFGKKEMALLYMVVFTAILLMGSGRYAVNRISFR